MWSSNKRGQLKLVVQNYKKGCYLHYRDISEDKNPGGIEKKVASQIKALNDAGLLCDFILCKQPETVVSKIISCLPFMPDGINWPSPKSISCYSFLYMRRPRFASKELIRFLKGVKKCNREIEIIYEIPTYPYDSEMRTPLLYSAFMKDKVNRKKLQACINKIACLGKEREIFGVNTIQINNGIDLSLITPKTPVSSLSEVHIIIVARFERWHGLDRLVAGMIDYYNNNMAQRNIILHIVGTGSSIKGLKRRVEISNLSDHIIFHGYCNFDELSVLYDQCSLAVESLGFHRRSGITVSASLKSREYLAKGIPFVSANQIDVFINKPVDFFLQVPSDETSINIESLLCFHDKLYESETQENLIKRIRLFAESNVGIDNAMREVIECITGGITEGL